jgi:hypothetical protein
VIERGQFAQEISRAGGVMVMQSRQILCPPVTQCESQVAGDRSPMGRRFGCSLVEAEENLAKVSGRDDVGARKLARLAIFQRQVRDGRVRRLERGTGSPDAGAAAGNSEAQRRADENSLCRHGFEGGRGYGALPLVWQRIGGIEVSSYVVHGND